MVMSMYRGGHLAVWHASTNSSELFGGAVQHVPDWGGVRGEAFLCSHQALICMVKTPRVSWAHVVSVLLPWRPQLAPSPLLGALPPPES